MPIPETLHLDLRRVPNGPQLAFRLSVYKRADGWILQTPASYIEPAVMSLDRHDVDRWIRDRAGRWLKDVGTSQTPGQWRFVDEDAIRHFFAFCGRPSPDRTEVEIEAERARREGAASRRDARESRAAALAKIPWPSSPPRAVKPSRILELHEGLEESWAFGALHVLGPDHVILGGGRGRTALTEDGGGSWSEQAIDSPHGIRCFWGVADDLHVVGQSGAAHSVDGGRSWSPRLSFERGAVGRVAGTSTERRFALEGGWLFSASSREPGGWEEIGPVREHGSFMESGLWVGEGELLACDVGGRIILSTDEGRSFEEVATRANEKEAFGAIAAADGVVIVVGKGGIRRKRPRILRSADAGRSFEEADVPEVPSADGHLFDVWGGGAGDWWACGSEGVLLHSRDGGLSWGLVDLGTDEHLCGVRGLPGGEMWLLGEESLWKSEAPMTEPTNVIRGLWSA